MRPRYLAALLVTLAGVALLPATTQRAARADTTGTPTFVNAYTCIVNDGGQTTRPAGSTIIIQQGFAEQSMGTLRDFLLAQTSIVSVNDASMFDVSDEYGKPVQGGGGYASFASVPTGVTLANPGDTMRFTFAIVINGVVPEVFNPAAGGEPAKPALNGPGLGFGGTCTVTAT